MKVVITKIGRWHEAAMHLLLPLLFAVPAIHVYFHLARDIPSSLTGQTPYHGSQELGIGVYCGSSGDSVSARLDGSIERFR